MNARYQILQMSRGFTLVELMVALAIGLFLIAGVFTAYVNGRRSQATVDDQVVMVDNVRFALETINADLRQAGVFGRVLAKSDESGAYNISLAGAPAVTAECNAGWTFNADAPIQVFNSNNPNGVNCNAGYLANTDVLEMRGTLRDEVTALSAGKIYLNSDVNTAQFFAGTTSPAISPTAKNYSYYASAYYIAAFTNAAADGTALDNIPSLHLVSLQPDGTVTNQMLLSGVENLQVQLGMDTDADAGGVVDQYINPPAVWLDTPATPNRGQIRSVQVWLVVRSQEVNPAAVSTAQTATMAGTSVTFANDGRRRMVVGTTVKLRNINVNSN